MVAFLNCNFLFFVLFFLSFIHTFFFSFFFFFYFFSTTHVYPLLSPSSPFFLYFFFFFYLIPEPLSLSLSLSLTWSFSSSLCDKKWRKRLRERKNKQEILLAPPLIEGNRLEENRHSLCQATPSALSPFVFLPNATQMGYMACVFFVLSLFFVFVAFIVMI